MSLSFLKDVSGDTFLGKEISHVVSKKARGALNSIVLDKGREMLQEEELDKRLVAGISCLILPSAPHFPADFSSAKQVGL